MLHERRIKKEKICNKEDDLHNLWTQGTNRKSQNPRERATFSCGSGKGLGKFSSPDVTTLLEDLTNTTFGNQPKTQNDLRSVYALKTTELHGARMGICKVLAWGFSIHLPAAYTFCQGRDSCDDQQPRCQCWRDSPTLDRWAMQTLNKAVSRNEHLGGQWIERIMGSPRHRSHSQSKTAYSWLRLFMYPVGTEKGTSISHTSG